MMRCCAKAPLLDLFWSEAQGFKKAKKDALAAAKPSADAPKRTSHAGYDLRKLNIPEEALPDPQKHHKGQHGYSTCAPNGAAPKQQT